MTVELIRNFNSPIYHNNKCCIYNNGYNPCSNYNNNITLYNNNYICTYLCNIHKIKAPFMYHSNISTKLYDINYNCKNVLPSNRYWNINIKTRNNKLELYFSSQSNDLNTGIASSYQFITFKTNKGVIQRQEHNSIYNFNIRLIDHEKCNLYHSDHILQFNFNPMKKYLNLVYEFIDFKTSFKFFLVDSFIDNKLNEFKHIINNALHM